MAVSELAMLGVFRPNDLLGHMSEKHATGRGLDGAQKKAIRRRTL